MGMQMKLQSTPVNTLLPLSVSAAFLFLTLCNNEVGRLSCLFTNSYMCTRGEKRALVPLVLEFTSPVSERERTLQSTNEVPRHRQQVDTQLTHTDRDMLPHSFASVDGKFQAP